MNGNFYQNPTFPGLENNMTPPGNISSQQSLPMEQSYIENILRLNKGKESTPMYHTLIVVNGKTKYILEILKKLEKIT